MDKNNIAHKVSALLNMTVERGATEAEAIAAAQMAQKLIAKYHVEVLPDVLKEEATVEEEVLSSTRKWQLRLAVVVGTNMSCKVLTHTVERHTVITLVGRETDQATARETFRMLLNVCLDGIRRIKSKAKAIYGSVSGVEISYATGFVDAVEHEMSKTSTALMLVVPESVNDFLNNKYPRMRHRSVRSQSTGFNERERAAKNEGYMDGKAAIGRRELTNGK